MRENPTSNGKKADFSREKNKLLSESEKIKLIKDLKEQLHERYVDEFDFILDFIDSRLNEQEKQELIGKLTQANISVEQAQKCIALIREHNLRGGGGI